VAIVLALVTAATFGIGDFCGGLATRRARVIQVVAWSHVVGGVGAITASVLLAERFDWGDIGLGIVGGAFGVVGVGLLYRRLAVGPMSVVAPLTAITSAVVPGLWGLVGGDRFGLLGWIGLVVALAAVLLVSSAPDQPSDGASRVTAQVIIESLAAGAGFGMLFVFFDATGSDSAPWPVAGARVFTSTVLLSFLVLVARRSSARPDSGMEATVVPRDGRAVGLIALAGVADTTANVTFLAATNAGQLALVSVLASLYPVSTVLLARLVLSERMSRPQGIGFGLAMTATVLLSIG
jgi:uncharacterized membrane protein